MTALEDALADSGGAQAPQSATAHLRALTLARLRSGEDELARPRSGYEEPVLVAFAVTGTELLALAPAPASIRADAERVGDRTWLLLAATVGVLCDLADPPLGPPPPLLLRAGELDGRLVLCLPSTALGPAELDELAPLALEERARGIDRLRARGRAVPAAVAGDAPATLREPIGASHPLRVAEAVARLGGDPRAPSEKHEELVLALLNAAGGGDAARPHEDPDPARRAARRMLQRLNGMGKWGGYHTDFAHLSRGFAGNERALAQAVGEALLSSGLLASKPSVGQRHVFLNPRRAADVHRLIDQGVVPGDLRLPRA